MSSNTNAKRKTIALYGNKCFIEELGLRSKDEVNSDLKRFKSKKQRAIMDELTYHHIIEKCKGGKATVENGAILRNINHQWFNRLSKEKQKEINNLFQEYKAKIDKERIILTATALSTKEISKPIKIELDINDNTDCLIIPAYDTTPEQEQQMLIERRKKQYAKFGKEYEIPRKKAIIDKEWQKEIFEDNLMELRY